jgi:uncharacterized coiled-coil DUF342 family protein
MKWSDIPAAAKMATASVVVIFSMLTFLFTTFQTDVEAAQYQQQNTQEISRFRIQNLETEIEELRFKIRFTKPPPEEEKWMRDQIERLEKKIECVKAGEC